MSYTVNVTSTGISVVTVGIQGPPGSAFVPGGIVGSIQFKDVSGVLAGGMSATLDSNGNATFNGISVEGVQVSSISSTAGIRLNSAEIQTADYLICEDHDGDPLMTVDPTGAVIATRFISRQIPLTSVSLRPGFCFNSADGDDANDGLTPQTAWKTCAKLIAKIADGTIVGGSRVDGAGNPADISTIPDVSSKRAWFNEYLAGRRRVTGSVIYFDTSKADFLVTGQVIFPPGCEVRSATLQRAKIAHNRPLNEVWTRPDASGHPHVWGTAGNTYIHSMVWEKITGAWAQLTPIFASDLAGALDGLESIVGSVYPDPATNKVYIHAIAGGNPNIDGVIREYSVFTNPANGSNWIVTGCDAHDLDCDGGATYDPVTTQSDGQYLIGVTSNLQDSCITVIENCTLTRAGKHHMAWVGGNNSATVIDALLCVSNVATSMAMGGIFHVFQSHFVDFMAYDLTNTGKAVSIYHQCSTPNAVSAIGRPGADSSQIYQSFLTHNSGVGTGLFAARIFDNSTIGGIANIGNSVTQEVIVVDCDFDGTFNSDAPITTITNTTSKLMLPGLGGANCNVVNCHFTAQLPAGWSVFGTTANGIYGNVTIKDSWIDAHAADGSSFIYGESWLRVDVLNLVMDGCRVNALHDPVYGLIQQLNSADSVAIHRSAFQNAITDYFADNYNGGGAGVSFKTYGDAVTAGWIDGTNIVDLAWSPPGTNTAIAAQPIATITPAIPALASANTFTAANRFATIGVGIAPLYPIHMEVTSGVVGAYFHDGSTETNSIGVFVAAGINNFNYAFVINNAINTVNMFVVRGDGNVGIGTFTPAATLDVRGTVAMPNLPTTDPHIAGQLWNSSGTLMISAG